MAKSGTFTDEARAAFLDALGDGYSVKQACHAAGFSRDTAYAHRRADPLFEDAWERALDEGTDRLEDEALRRAVVGVEEPIVYRGQVTGQVVRKYSDSLLTFLLKARRPEKFRERSEVRHSGGIDPISPERLAQIRAAGGDPELAAALDAVAEHFGRELMAEATRSGEGTSRP